MENTESDLYTYYSRGTFMVKADCNQNEQHSVPQSGIDELVAKNIALKNVALVNM